MDSWDEEEGKGRVVCVTGAGGYVASWLVKLLLSKGYIVHGTVRDPGDEKNAHLKKFDKATKNLILFQADLRNYNSLCASIAGCVGVFHVACPVPSSPVSNPEDAPLSDNEWVEDDGANLSGEEGAGGDDDATQGGELEPEGEGATQGREGVTQRGEAATQRGEAATRRAPKSTYLRKRKTTSRAATAREKDRRAMRQLEEESNRSEPETEDEEDDAAITYKDTSGFDDSMDDGDDPVRSYDPNFKLPGSDASMFHI